MKPLSSINRSLLFVFTLLRPAVSWRAEEGLFESCGKWEMMKGWDWGEWGGQGVPVHLESDSLTRLFKFFFFSLFWVLSSQKVEETRICLTAHLHHVDSLNGREF